MRNNNKISGCILTEYYLDVLAQASIVATLNTASQLVESIETRRGFPKGALGSIISAQVKYIVELQVPPEPSQISPSSYRSSI